MAYLYVSEFQKPRGVVGTMQSEGLPQPNVADQTVAIGSGSTQSNPFNALTNAILISCDAVCSIAIGANPVASASTFRLPANVPPVKFTVRPGDKIAVITNT